MTRYTYDRRRDGRCEIRGRGEGVIARTEDHRQAERIVDALNREAYPLLTVVYDGAVPGTLLGGAYDPY